MLTSALVLLEGWLATKEGIGVIKGALDLLTELATVCKLETLDSSDVIELRGTLDVVTSSVSPKSGKSMGPSPS